LRCTRGDHLKFSKMLEICVWFTNIDELIKEALAMTSVATERQHMIPDAGVDALQIDVLLWAMEEVKSDDPRQIAWWTKHRSLVRAPAVDAAGPVAPAIINLHDDDGEMWIIDANAEAVQMVDGHDNAKAVEMVVAAPAPGSRTIPLEFDDYVRQGYNSSARLKARRAGLH